MRFVQIGNNLYGVNPSINIDMINMFSSKIKLDKKNGCAEFFGIYKLTKEESLFELLAIISLFELEDVDMESVVTVEQDSDFLTLKNDNGFKPEMIETRKRPFSKKKYHMIKFEFIGRKVRSLIELAAKENVPVYITSVDESIELDLNDNDQNRITFSMGRYDADIIGNKIKIIKQGIPSCVVSPG